MEGNRGEQEKWRMDEKKKKYEHEVEKGIRIMRNLNKMIMNENRRQEMEDKK